FVSGGWNGCERRGGSSTIRIRSPASWKCSRRPARNSKNFKSFPIAQDDHFLRLCRYVERSAARAGLVRRAEAWRSCSLRQLAQEPRPDKWLLSDWPVAVRG